MLIFEKNKKRARSFFDRSPDIYPTVFALLFPDFYLLKCALNTDLRQLVCNEQVVAAGDVSSSGNLFADSLDVVPVAVFAFKIKLGAAAPDVQAHISVCRLCCDKAVDDLHKLRVVVAARQYHGRYSSPPIGRPPACSARPSTATARAMSA